MGEFVALRNLLLTCLFAFQKGASEVKLIESDIERYQQDIANLQETVKARLGKSHKSLEAVKQEYASHPLPPTPSLSPSTFHFRYPRIFSNPIIIFARSNTISDLSLPI